MKSIFLTFLAGCDQKYYYLSGTIGTEVMNDRASRDGFVVFGQRLSDEERRYPR